MTDQHLAPAVTSRLRREGVAVTVHSMSPASKTAVYEELRSRLYDGALELPNLPELIVELRRLRTKITDDGLKVINPRAGGSHGDMAQALALAAWEHRLVSGHGRKLTRPDPNLPGARPITVDLSLEDV